jgi:RNA polymerase sigma-70 factor (ECF subfamily)
LPRSKPPSRAAEVLDGWATVLAFLSEVLHTYWAGHRWMAADINGLRGYVLTKDGAPDAVVSFAYDAAGAMTDVYIVRNPEKLASLGVVAIH